MMWNTYNSSGYGMHAPFWFIWWPVIGIWALISLALKGYSLWHAAKRNEMWWFIALLILNTLGILELVYIIFVLKKVNLRGIAHDHDHHHDHPHHDHAHHDHNHHDHEHGPAHSDNSSTQQ